jgi:pimeloyl-CoA dehydrogenase small subunit
MDFDFTEEQRLLRDSVERLLADRYAFDKRRVYLAEPEGWSRAMWSHYAELGLLGLPFAEQPGGFGGGGIDVMLVMEAFGRALVLEPYLATVVLAGTALRLAGSAAQQAALLPLVAEGKLLLAFAHAERQARYDLSDVLTTAKPKGGGWVLDGAKSIVMHGDSADRLVVSARTAGSRNDIAGITLFLVDAAAQGVARRSYTMRDGTRAADLALSGVELGADAVLGEIGAGFAVIERVVEAGIAATAAEAVGAMETMQAMTLEYLKTRVQFGRPIAVFQALQFRAADMYVALEQARSMALLARLSLDDDDPAARQRTVRAAKIQVDLSSRQIGQESIQLHGGIGMTMEYPVGHYFKRSAVIGKTFADTSELIELVGADGGLIG